MTPAGINHVLSQIDLRGTFGPQCIAVKITYENMFYDPHPGYHASA